MPAVVVDDIQAIQVILAIQAIQPILAILAIQAILASVFASPAILFSGIVVMPGAGRKGAGRAKHQTK